MKYLTLILSCVAACGAPTASSPATSSAPPRSRVRERLAPCSIEGVSEKLLCGRLAVWENRTTKRGRKIELNIVVAPALGPDVAPDPVFPFAGGPGDYATNGASYWAENRAVRARRDIVMIDQRGTGASNRLDCKVPRDPADVQGYFESPLPVAEVRRCRAELEQIADLTQYSTSIAADDVDEVRAWLGYDKINLDGGSYGTRAAQVYMRRHGAHVRSATLLGVVGMDQYLPVFHARDGKRSLDLLFETCARDAACATAFPDLPKEHARVLAGLERTRGRATVTSPVDQREVEVTIPRDLFAEHLRVTLYSAGTAAATPFVVHRAAQGDFGPFAKLAMMREPSFRSILAFGMHMSVGCTDDVPAIPPGMIEPAIAGTYLGGYRVNQLLEACKEWPRGESPADMHEPVTSDIPTLLISGNYDPVTPPSWAEQVAAHLSRAFHLVVPDAHHGSGGLSNPECLAGITATFLERGSSEGLDVSCVASMKRPPFLLDEAAFTAQMQANR